MKQNVNNNSESKNVVKNMKQLLNDESNLFNEVELKLFGVQAYGVTYGEEYNVITKAARRANGRYYFITREGYEIAWSTIPADKVAKICADMFDQMEQDKRLAEEVEQVDECTTARRHTNAARIMQTAQVIAEAVGAFTGSTYPAHDIKTDCTRFAKWIEGEECETINPAAPFWFAVRKQGAESGTREYVKERCAGLGAPVYVLKVERETLPGLFTLTVRVSSPATAAQIFEAATANNEPTEGGAAAEGSNTNPEATEPATEAQNEPQSEPKAPTLAEIAADYAAGTADSIRRRWHAFAAKATTAARAAGCYIGGALILAVTAAAFILSAWFVPDMVESWPDLPRIFGVVVGVFGFTMGVEYLTIKVCDAIDAKTGFFGFNPLAYRR